MENLTVLVTSIDTPIALGVLKCLKEMKNITVIGTDYRTLTTGNIFCDRVYRISRFTESKDDYFKQLKEIIDEEQVQALFPCDPHEIALYEDYKQRLTIPFALPESSHFDRLTDKEATYVWLVEQGFSEYIPTYYAFTSHDKLASLIHNEFKDEDELVVKNTSIDVASDFAVLTHREKFIETIETQQSHVFAFEDYLNTNNTDRRMVMKKLDPPEFSVDLYVYDSKTVVCVPRHHIVVSDGLVFDGTVIEHTELIAISIEIAEAIIDEGFINLQFMKEDGNFKLTDVNPRFCDSQVMSLGAGVNFPELFLTYSLTAERPIPKPQWNTRMVRYKESVFYQNYNADDEPAVWTDSKE